MIDSDWRNLLIAEEHVDRMAVFPQGLSNLDQRCNPGERRVLHQLKRCLEDDYLVWHDLPIGLRARQPDFIILSPRWGVLLLEVKHWKRGTLLGATRDAVTLQTDRGRVTDANPLRQARDVTLGRSTHADEAPAAAPALNRPLATAPKLGTLMPNMGRTSTPRPRHPGRASAPFFETPQRVLGLLFGQPGRSFYASELIGLAGMGSGAVQREFAKA